MLNLVTVVGRNTHILPHMLKHYRDKVDKIYVVAYRYSENDTILSELEELDIQPYKVFTDVKFNWNRVTEIYNQIKLEKPNDWWIVSDDDELQVYPTDLEYLIKNCERNGWDFISGGFLDRLGKNGVFPKVYIYIDIHKEFPMAGFFRYPLSGACPNKVTLMRGYQKISSGQHYAEFSNGTNSWGGRHPKSMPIEECFTQVHHFKWDSTCVLRIKEVADVGKDYAYSNEYQKMYNAIKGNNWKIDIKNKDFMFHQLKNKEYIDYYDYPYWKELTQKIIQI
jgi:hypothetical protein